jgi:hypothetical protein
MRPRRVRRRRYARAFSAELQKRLAELEACLPACPTHFSAGGGPGKVSTARCAVGAGHSRVEVVQLDPSCAGRYSDATSGQPARTEGAKHVKRSRGAVTCKCWWVSSEQLGRSASKEPAACWASRRPQFDGGQTRACCRASETQSMASAHSTERPSSRSNAGSRSEGRPAGTSATLLAPTVRKTRCPEAHPQSSRSSSSRDTTEGRVNRVVVPVGAAKTTLSDRRTD